MFLIVVFAKNEEENIPFVVDDLLQIYGPDRIIFVLDGDFDPSVNILAKKSIKFRFATCNRSEKV